MSDLPPLEQQFSFEASAVRLEDGTIFQPLRDARRCFAMETESGYRFMGSTWEALYECKDERFILLRFSSPMVRRGLWQPKVKQAEQVTGGEVDPHFAVQFLIAGQFPIPDHLQELTKRTTSEPVEMESDMEPRPSDFWLDKPITQPSKYRAHEVQIVKLLEELRDVAIDLVHEIRDWEASPARNHQPIAIFYLRFTERYRVIPEHWWGAVDTVPPQWIVLEELRWPYGVEPLRTTVLPELKRLILPSASAIFCSMSISQAAVKPTESEVELAEKLLADACKEIDVLVASLMKTLNDLTSGRVFATQGDYRGPKNSKIGVNDQPSNWPS